jgi:hypothetical protein
MTWTGCAKSLTTSRTRRWWRSISASRSRACQIRSAPTKVLPNTTMRGCAGSLTNSASITSLCHRPPVTRRDVSTRLCSKCCSISRRSWRSCCLRSAKSGRRPIRHFCRSTHRAESSCRCLWSSTMPRPAPSLTNIPIATSASQRLLPAAAASCNGSRIGRCVGLRSASITKWPARI